MRDKIEKILRNLEREKNIRILMAVESGSRAWGMESSDSDYDVRFVFCHPMESYLGIKEPNEVITAAFDENGDPMSPEGCFIDMQGFDIKKFARMACKSNPTVLEWLNSDITYVKEYPYMRIIRMEAQEHFNPLALYHHYRSLCKQNYEKYLKSHNAVTYKKYLYAMRGLINAEYVRESLEIPDIDFNIMITAAETYYPLIPATIASDVREMIRLKKTGNEKKEIPNINRVDKFIERFLKTDATEEIKEKFPQGMPSPWDDSINYSVINMIKGIK